MTELAGGPAARSATGLPRMLPAVLVVSACALMLVLGAAAPAASAATVPAVQYMQPEHVTETSATLQAEIDPEGAETSWEIYLQCQSPESEDGSACEPVAGGPQRHAGTISAITGTELVQAEVSGLRPGYHYKYSVLATNAAGKEGWVGNGLVMCSSPGGCGQPVEFGEAYWNLEGAERAAREAPRIEAELEAKKRGEEEERLGHEARLREEGERAGREAAERERAAHNTVCVVPELRGDTLARARKMLRRAHCRLGKVTRRSGRAKLVVAHQGVRPGRRLAKGSAVRVKLARLSRERSRTRRRLSVGMDVALRGRGPQDHAHPRTATASPQEQFGDPHPHRCTV